MRSKDNEGNRIKHRKACNFVSGVVFLTCGFFLLLCGVGIIGLSVLDMALPAALLSLGIIFIFTAFIDNNSVALWLSFCFIVPSIIIILVCYVDGLTYQNMFPAFIAIPSIASLFTMLMSKQYRIHLYISSFFLALTVLFFLKSFGIFGYKIVIPLLIILLGIIILLYTFKNESNNLSGEANE